MEMDMKKLLLLTLLLFCARSTALQENSELLKFLSAQKIETLDENKNSFVANQSDHFQCIKCNAAFTQSSGLIKHKKTHISKPTPLTDDDFYE